MSDKPIMWRVDPIAESQGRLDVSIKLHREAGKRGFSCSPKRSSIDGRYFAEINHMVPTGRAPDGIPSHTTRFNVAMGTGATPLEAAANGYRRAVPVDDMMAVLYLEIEAHLLCETARVYGKLDAALADLSSLLQEFAE